MVVVEDRVVESLASTAGTVAAQVERRRRDRVVGAHDVRLAVSQRSFGHGGIGEAAAGYRGNAPDVAFHRGVQISEGAGRLMAIRQMLFDRGEVALAQREIIDLSGGAQHLGGPASVVECQPAVGKFVDAEPVAYNAGWPHGGTHGGEDLQGKAHAVLKTAAEFVLSPVAERRHELLQQIALRAVHLDAVEPGLHRMRGGGNKALDQVADLIARDFVRHAAAVVAGHGGRSPQ